MVTKESLYYSFYYLYGFNYIHKLTVILDLNRQEIGLMHQPGKDLMELAGSMPHLLPLHPMALLLYKMDIR